MKAVVRVSAAVGALLFLLASAGRGLAAELAVQRPEAKDTYTITAQLELVAPFNLADMNDEFQRARLVSSTKETSIFEITYFPLHQPTVGENSRWREEYAEMTEYLRPTPAENWDEAMRRDLLAALRSDGIDPEKLTDRQVVEQVSRWAMRRAKHTSAFSIWAIHFPEGKAEVLPALQPTFRRLREKEGLTEEQMIQREVLGRSMYYERVRGSCTSSSIYLSTIFRALGIPTRIVVCIPPFDANDRAQAELFYKGVGHPGVRETVRNALEGMGGFANHLFNEVYVGNRWVRLNYSTLGQPVLDQKYFGLLTHILTVSDYSRMPMAETWGRRYFQYSTAPARLSSVNPYRLVAIKDALGENAPKTALTAVAVPAELTTATIVGLLRPDSPELPRYIKWPEGRMRPDFLISYREWVKGTYQQMRVFQGRVGQRFLLKAEGHPTVQARLLEARFSQGDGSFQAYGVQVLPDDVEKIVPGAAYTIQPLNTSEVYRWELDTKLKPVVLR